MYVAINQVAGFFGRGVVSSWIGRACGSDFVSLYVKEMERSDLIAIICAAEGDWY